MSDDQHDETEGTVCPGCGKVHEPFDPSADFDPATWQMMNILAAWIGYSSNAIFHPEKGSGVSVSVNHPLFQFVANIATLAKKGESAVDPNFDMSTLKEGEEPPMENIERTPEMNEEALHTLIDQARTLVEEGQGYLNLLFATPEQGGNA